MNIIARKTVNGFDIYERVRPKGSDLLKWVVYDAANFQRGEFRQFSKAVKWCQTIQVLNPVARIAWATKSASNGRITHWSRIHRTVFGVYTLCGVAIPIYTKHQRLGPDEGDYRIQGGNCAACQICHTCNPKDKLKP